MPHGKGDAKKKMLESLSKEMRDMMGENYAEGMKDKMMKVSVAGEEPEDIEKGLDLAEKIMKKRMGDDGEAMGMGEMMSEMSEEDEMAGGGIAKKDKYAEGGVINKEEMDMDDEEYSENEEFMGNLGEDAEEAGVYEDGGLPMEQMEGESMEEYHQRMMDRIKELEAMLGESEE